MSSGCGCNYRHESELHNDERNAERAGKRDTCVCLVPFDRFGCRRESGYTTGNPGESGDSIHNSDAAAEVRAGERRPRQFGGLPVSPCHFVTLSRPQTDARQRVTEN